MAQRFNVVSTLPPGFTHACLKEWGVLAEGPFKGRLIAIAIQASLLTPTQGVWFLHHLWGPSFPPNGLATPTIR